MSLELATTTELLEELQKRFDHTVFAGVAEWTSNSQRRYVNYSGDYIVQVGLTELAKDVVLRKMREAET